MARLSNATLHTLPAAVARPAYDRSRVTPGIVHLGIGAFHRAHQAVTIDDRLAAGETSWGIVGASLRAADTADALNPQDGLYTVAIRDGAGTRMRVVGSVSEVLVAQRDPARLMQALTDPRVRIVSLTVTEKGYCHDPARGVLNEEHPAIIADLATPRGPRSVPGLIVEALALRFASGVAPFTVMSCDNLPDNGHTAGRVIRRYAELRGAALARQIEDQVAFPCTMVDRIVPATTDVDRALVAEALGVTDAWPVMTEPFTQWVVEDRFPAGRPRFEEAAAELVADVRPYEKMKLRLLNGTHSAMAYLGQLSGLETVADTISDPAIARFIRRLMDEEISATIPEFGAPQLAAYKDALIARYRNPALRHRTAQIAMDGSQKIPQRMIGTAQDQLAAGRSVVLIGTAIAAFLRFMVGTGPDGQVLPVNDPLAGLFQAAATESGASGVTRLAADDARALAARLAPAMLGIEKVFSGAGRDQRLVAAVASPLAQLLAGDRNTALGV